jgi:NAD+ kinase
VSCDGEVTAELVPGRSLRVHAAQERLELVHPRGYDYFQILRSKLRWGRNQQRDPGAAPS